MRSIIIQGLTLCFIISNIDTTFVRLLSWDQKSNLEISQVWIEEISSWKRRLRGFKGVSLGPGKFLCVDY